MPNEDRELSSEEVANIRTEQAKRWEEAAKYGTENIVTFLVETKPPISAIPETLIRNCLLLVFGELFLRRLEKERANAKG